MASGKMWGIGTNMQCYYIIGKNEKGEDVRCPKEQDTPFCCDDHHNKWADINYGKSKDGRGKQALTIEEMQQKLKKMGEKPGQLKIE